MFTITTHRFDNQHVVIITRATKCFVYKHYFPSAVKAAQFVTRTSNKIKAGEHANPELWSVIQSDWMARFPASRTTVINRAITRTLEAA